MAVPAGPQEVHALCQAVALECVERALFAAVELRVVAECGAVLEDCIDALEVCDELLECTQLLCQESQVPINSVQGTSVTP